MKEESSVPAPQVKKGSRFNRVWIIPVIAILLGGWLVKRTHDERGEIVEVTFETAEGIEEGKTEVRCRNVRIGTVEKIGLRDDLTVETALRIRPEHLHLITEGSQFWVVRPRISGASVSGLGTLLSGAYIEVDPGQGESEKRQFVGLEEPPLTPVSVPGLRLSLVTDKPGSVDVGSGLYFSDSLIGRVESRTFIPDRQVVRFGVFIDDRFRNLITGDTLFWKSSGITLDVGTDGVNLQLPSLDSFVAGRIEVGLPEGVEPGRTLLIGTELTLYQNREQAESSAIEGGAEFLLLAEQSLRGLRIGAPVEFRGLKVGRVAEISYSLTKGATIEQLPILIQLDQRLLTKHFPPSLLDDEADGFQGALRNGLRASIRSSSLLTGQLYVEMDYYPELGPTVFEQRDGRIVLPVIQTGLEQLEEKVASLLDKLNELEIETLIAKVGTTADEATATLSTIQLTLMADDSVVGDARRTMVEMTETLKALRGIIESQETQAIPADLRKTLAQLNESLQPLSNDGAVYGDLRRTLDELRATARSFDRMATEIADKPNSLLFGKDPTTKKIPRARKR